MKDIARKSKQTHNNREEKEWKEIKINDHEKFSWQLGSWNETVKIYY